MIYEKGMTILYVILNKAVYRCLRFPLLFYERLVADMRGKGFEHNTYDPCVPNKKFEVKQVTVCWHVDGLKVLHLDPKEFNKYMEWIEGI